MDVVVELWERSDSGDRGWWWSEMNTSMGEAKAKAKAGILERTYPRRLPKRDNKVATKGNLGPWGLQRGQALCAEYKGGPAPQNGHPYELDPISYAATESMTQD